jgi:hypothetical protein
LRRARNLKEEKKEKSENNYKLIFIKNAVISLHLLPCRQLISLPFYDFIISI